MSTPLTDAINALTTYANGVTGASDTNLSDAVHTLADGYGQGGGAETVTLTINDDGGVVANLYEPASASWTDFEYDEDYLHRSGILTIPQNSMFVVLIIMNNVTPISDVITSEYVDVAAMRGQGAYPYVCHVGTSDGTIRFG